MKNLRDFVPGQNEPQDGYSCFQPTTINHAWIVDDMALMKLLSQADRELGRLDMYSDYIPNIDLFIRMHVVKEATKSSKIEGTQTRIEDALREKEDIARERRDDWEEVQNYISAMNIAIDRLGTLPFSSRLAKETHHVLMQGVRGSSKRPGEFRETQNWIGGATLADAVFIPPKHGSIAALMTDLEKFVHEENGALPELLKIAFLHYQFETIHPFLDGNGRVGRLLITLYLVSRGILKKPILYLSDFFERNRTLYYENLMRVREAGDILQWFRFFLVGVVETAKNGIDTFDRILQLQKSVEERIQTLGSRAVNAQSVVNQLYKSPIANAAKVANVTGTSSSAAYRLIADLERLEILREVTGGKRGKTYLFDEYLDLFSE